MSSFHNFSAEVERLAAEWRNIVVTKEVWEITGARNQPGEAQGFWVRSSTVSGYAKPGRNVPPVTQHCRAAHEKIAADLAFELGLPIPPVVLWERVPTPARCERYCAISALPFARANPWRDVMAMPAVAARIVPLLGCFASAMAPFDTWLGNADRHNPGNLIVSEDTSSAPTLRVAYIDYANSLSLGWPDPARAAAVSPVPHYPADAGADVVAMAEIIGKIEALQEGTVRSIVMRVPSSFLPERARTITADALVQRRGELRRALKTIYPMLS